MASKSELDPGNYKRIFVINTLLSVPLLILFAWPYLVFSSLLSAPNWVAYSGSILFSVPFTLTLLHGHVTLALGPAHRRHYYHWLQDHPLTYGLLFHPMVTRTRFRLVMLTISLLLLLGSWLARLL